MSKKKLKKRTPSKSGGGSPIKKPIEPKKSAFKPKTTKGKIQRWSSRGKSFKHAVRDSRGRFVSVEAKERELVKVKRLKQKNPELTQRELNLILYPPPIEDEKEFTTDALEFNQEFENYSESNPLYYIINTNGEKFSFGRNQKRARSLIELEVGNLWREAKDALESRLEKQKKNKKKRDKGNYIPEWSVTLVEDENGRILRVLYDFSKNNINGEQPDRMSQFGNSKKTI